MRVVSFSSGGYLNATAHFGTFVVNPISFLMAKSLTFTTAPSMSNGRLRRISPISRIRSITSSAVWTTL